MIVKHIFILLMTWSTVQVAHAQQPLITKNSTTSFFSHAPLEDIEAVNKQTTAALDLARSEVVVKMLIKHFEFENKLMQEHFNENYMESEQFPAAIFKGSFASKTPIDAASTGEYEVIVEGTMTIHGVTRPLHCEATIAVEEGTVRAITTFNVRPEDFDIEIPKLVVKNIAEEIEVTSELFFENVKS